MPELSDPLPGSLSSCEGEEKGERTYRRKRDTTGAVVRDFKPPMELNTGVFVCFERSPFGTLGLHPEFGGVGLAVSQLQSQGCDADLLTEFLSCLKG